MDSDSFDERIVIRVPGDLKARIQKVAEEEETTVTGAARTLIREGLDSGWRIDEKIALIKNLEEQNRNLMGTFGEYLDRVDYLEGIFDKCVISLMAVLQENASEAEKHEMIEYFSPHATLAQRRMEDKKAQHERIQAVIKKAATGAESE